MPTQSFQSHARTVSLLTVISRLTGLARDATLSRVFGASALMDAFFFAFMIPNLFRRLFGEGALAAAFLPVYTQLTRDDPQRARQLASLTVARLVTALGCVVLVGEVALYAISAAADHANLAVWLTMITLPYMPLICLVAVLGAMLQVHGRFGPTAAAPILLNLVMIGAALLGAALLDPEGQRGRLVHVGVLAGSVVLAGVLQMAWSLWALRGRGWWVADRAGGRGPARQVLGQAVPMIAGLGVLQLNSFFDGLIASYPTTVGPTVLGVDYPLGEGAMAAVSFAQRLYQFPLGVFGIAVATAMFPALARQADDGERFDETVRRGLRLVVFIGLPASVGLLLVRQPLVAVTLEGGRFTAEQTARVGFVLLGYAPAVWAYSMIHVLTRVFYARKDARRPVRVAVGVVTLNLVLNLALIWTPLRESGLAWSTAICAAIQALVLLAMLRRHVVAPLDGAVLGSWARTAALTAVMGAAVAGAAAWAPRAATWAGSLWTLLGLVAVGAAVMVAGAAALRMPELRWAGGGG